MEEKLVKIKFRVNRCGNVREIKYECDKDTLVKTAIEYLGKVITDGRLKLIIDGDNIPGVTFKKDGVNQKARANFKLLEFLNNFGYDLNSVEISWLCGMGGGFALNNGIMIRINADEPHAEPHVHVYPGRFSEFFVRISLTSFTQMKGDKEEFTKLFDRKNRKTIEKVLKDKKNNSKFIEYYNRATKGEYI